MTDNRLDAVLRNIVIAVGTVVLIPLILPAIVLKKVFGRGSFGR
jgi:hypothetical protein